MIFDHRKCSLVDRNFIINKTQLMHFFQPISQVRVVQIYHSKPSCLELVTLALFRTINEANINFINLFEHHH